MTPSGKMAQITEQDIGQKRQPNLPAHCVGIVPEEVGDLERLFDLLEEHLDLPSAAIEIGHGVGTPGKLITQEDHLALLAVHFHQSHDAPHDFGRGFPFISQGDEFVCHDPRMPLNGQFLHDFVAQILFGSRDPVNAALIEMQEMAEVQITLVEYDDFAGLQSRAQFAGAAVVMLARGVDNHALRQETLQVQSQVSLGGDGVWPNPWRWPPAQSPSCPQCEPAL